MPIHGSGLQKEMVRMRRIGEGLGYLRQAKYLRIEAGYHMRKASTLQRHAKNLLAKADRAMGLGKEN
jgi:hypothetical protein